MGPKVFGTAPDHPAVGQLPQHGVARITRWEFLGKSTSEAASDSVKLDFGLSSENLDDKLKSLWNHKFGIIYSVTLERNSLSTSLVVTNEGNEPFEFQTLMHTYLRVKVPTSFHPWQKRFWNQNSTVNSSFLLLNRTSLPLQSRTSKTLRISTRSTTSRPRPRKAPSPSHRKQTASTPPPAAPRFPSSSPTPLVKLCTASSETT